MAETVKFQMSLGEDLNDFAIAEANRIGITKNAFIAICIDTYKKQAQTLDMNDTFKRMLVESEKNETSSKA
jgi:hypothetical protein